MIVNNPLENSIALRERIRRARWHWGWWVIDHFGYRGVLRCYFAAGALIGFIIGRLS
jgi:hypothetical protein